MPALDGRPFDWPSALPLVAILRGIEPHEAAAHARALLDAGFDTIEVPTNSPDWASSVATIATLAGTRALVGAGTVLRNADLDALQAAGGRLAVSPHVDPALVAESLRRGLVTMPGALTASEALSAWRAGARVVKIFPAASLGAGHVRALRSVLPAEISLVAVGGIDVTDLGDYRRAGCVGAGLGSDLYRPGQSATLTGKRARAFVDAWQNSAP